MILTFAAFFCIAAIYSAAGFGGGSSYLALLTVTLPDRLETIRTLALACNLVVVGGSVPMYWRAGLYDRRAWPLLLLSVPAAAAGAAMRLPPSIFLPLLGGTLFAAGSAMLIKTPKESFITDVVDFAKKPSPQPPMPINSPATSTTTQAILGGTIGLLSGMVSIGGGIFLSPVLHLIRWDEARRIAAIAALFILVNSAAGLAGRVASGEWTVQPAGLWWLLAVVAAGGQMGSRWSIGPAGRRSIRTLTGILVIAAGVRLLVVG